MAIYTKTGDKGDTSLLGGTRVPKSNERIAAYGTIDELNSSLGVARAFFTYRQKLKIDRECEAIQHDLFAIGTSLASPKLIPVDGLNKRTKHFEKLIDKMTQELPELHNFILPGGGQVSALFHVSRTITRRAERQVVALAKHETVEEQIIPYLNRLSDLFFTLARYANYLEKKKDVVWKK